MSEYVTPSITEPSIDTIPMPALPAPVMVRWSKLTSEKSPQVSEPNWVALFAVDRIVESCTWMWWLGNVLPSAKSLFSTIASSTASMREWPMSTFQLLTMLMPSRSADDRILMLSNVRSWHPLNSTAKCPARLMVTPETWMSEHSLSESTLSPTPFLTSLPVTSPSPSIVPVPVMATSCTPSPHMSALWKWLCPKSCHCEKEFDSGASSPLDAALIVAPLDRFSVTLDARWIERDR